MCACHLFKSLCIEEQYHLYKCSKISIWPILIASNAICNNVGFCVWGCVCSFVFSRRLCFWFRSGIFFPFFLNSSFSHWHGKYQHGLRWDWPTRRSMELPLPSSERWSDRTSQLKRSAQLPQLDVRQRHRQEQAKVARQSHNSSRSGGTSSLPTSGPQSRLRASARDSRLPRSEFTCTLHSLPPYPPSPLLLKIPLVRTYCTFLYILVLNVHIYCTFVRHGTY